MEAIKQQTHNWCVFFSPAAVFARAVNSKVCAFHSRRAPATSSAGLEPQPPCVEPKLGGPGGYPKLAGWFISWKISDMDDDWG